MSDRVRALLGRRVDSEHATVLAGWGARVVAVGTQLLTLPMLVRALGAEGYGVYAVAVSLFGWYLLADLGTGATLQNRISARRAHGASAADDIVSGVLGLLAVFPALALAVVGSGVLLARLVWTPAQASLAGDWLIVVAGIPFVFSGFGSVAYKILHAQHVGYRAWVNQAIGSVLALAATYAVFRAELPLAARLVGMVLAYAVPPALLATVLLLGALRGARAEGGRFKAALFKRTVRDSAGFLGIALLSLLTLQADYMILASTVAPGEILKYNVISKVAGLALAAFGAVLQAQWSACAEAAARNDWRALDARRLGLLRAGLAVMAGFGVLFAVFQHPIMVLVSPRAPEGLGLEVVLVYTLYLLARMWTDTHGVLLQSMGRLRIFLVYAPVQAVCSLTLQIVLARAYGVGGLVLGMLASFLLTACWILPRHLRAVRRSMLAAEPA